MTLLLISALLIPYTKNPLHAVLALILVFINGALILLKLNADFLALIYVVVYVGAICVLFLFVIMLLNIRNTEIVNKPTYKNEILSYTLVTILITGYLTYSQINIPNQIVQTEITNLLSKNSETTFILQFIAQNIVSFILLTLLLYLAIIAPIFISKNK